MSQHKQRPTPPNDQPQQADTGPRRHVLTHDLITRREQVLAKDLNAAWIAFPPKASCIDGLSVPPH
jgi:hypothetical protein